MKLATVSHPDGVAFGIVDGDEIADLSRAPIGAATLRGLIEQHTIGEMIDAARTAPRVAIGASEWMPIIPDPPQIFCVGLNYDEHRAEVGRERAEHPTLFLRLASSLIGHRQAIVRSPSSRCYDFEGELAVIIGRPGHRIAREDALFHVAGYAPFNDVSVRDWQRHTSQWTPGKNFVGTGCLGPWMVTPDELGEIGPQTLRTRVNGRVEQEAPLADMLFPVPELISYISEFTPLLVGDVIATGTPGGVGFLRTPPLYLDAGDTVEVEIAGVGTLTNPVADG